MNKIIKQLIVITMIGLIGIGCFTFFVSQKKDDIPQLTKEQNEENNQQLLLIEDESTFEQGMLIGVHLGLGEVFGKAMLSNGGIPFTQEDQKKRLRELRNIDFYPNELKRIMELLSHSISKKDHK